MFKDKNNTQNKLTREMVMYFICEFVNSGHIKIFWDEVTAQYYFIVDDTKTDPKNDLGIDPDDILSKMMNRKNDGHK